MRNYIILNNQNSNEISGLIIQELAPISKPLQRTQVETIDGRDGDIVTPLGYAAYNKKIKIGLYGNFNINDIIAYFATKGTVIFSNEPDKYYYYQIVDQIDYERLVRYRVATVTMHVQPFKYSATEGTITVDSSDTVSDEGSDIALDGTAEAPFNVLRHKGNATQETLSGKNLFDINATPSEVPYAAYTITDNAIRVVASSSSGTSRVTIPITLAPNTQYRVSFTSTVNTRGGTPSASFRLRVGSTSYGVVNLDGDTVGASVKHEVTFTTTSDTTGLGVWFYVRAQNNTDASDITFKDVQVELGNTTTAYEPYCGGVPSPNPDYPQDINVVTGDSTVVICSKNSLSAPQDYTEDRNGLVFTCTGGIYNIRGNASLGNQTADHDITQPYTIREGDYWHLCNDFTDTHIQIALVFTDGSFRNYSPSVVNRIESLSAYAGKTVAKIRFYYNSGYSINVNIKPMILNGVSTATDFIPYQGQSYVIPFGDTYLAKIGDYADEPVKVDGTWYIRRAIGKVVLDGTESWSLNSNERVFWFTQADAALIPAADISPILSDYYIASSFGYLYNASVDYGISCHNSNHWLAIRNKDISTVANFKAWLAAHNTTVYYPLATPTDEAITDQDLIDALDELYDQAHSYKGHTHITATAADGNAPAVLAVDVNEDNESTVTNAGNTTSRPILTIYGQGDIGVYINDVEVLDVALGDEEYITLDSVEMEAYKDTTANLKNRLVTGDYSKLALNAGANKIRFTGKVTKYEISKYSRWL